MKKNFANLLIALGVVSPFVISTQLMAQEFDVESSVDSLEVLHGRIGTLSLHEKELVDFSSEQFIGEDLDIRRKMFELSLRKPLLDVDGLERSFGELSISEKLEYHLTLNKFDIASDKDRLKIYLDSMIKGGLRDGRTIDPCREC
jgi:hypothetical protein